MFERLGHFVIRRARAILVIAGIVVVLAAVVGIHASSRLKPAGFVSAHAPSQLAMNRLDESFGGTPNMLFLVTANHGTVDSPAVVAAARALTARIEADSHLDKAGSPERAARPTITAVTSYWDTHSPNLASRDRTEGLVMLHIVGSDEMVADRSKALIAQLATPTDSPTEHVPGPVTIRPGGFAATNDAISSQIGKDLALAEGIAIPITAILLVFVFGSAVAALLPVSLGVMTIFMTLAVLFVLGSITNVSIYALNLTTAMGLGLAIDYSLLMVARFREELAAGHDPTEAVVRAVARAGRTIVFSAATVAAAMTALVVFPLYFLRSFAYAAVSVVIVATIGAVIVLPALLTVLGPRVNAGAVRSRARLERSESPFWRRVATRVMARPILTGLPVVILLLALGLPFLHVHFGTPDDRVIQPNHPARAVGDVLRENFAVNPANTLDVVTPTALRGAAAAAYARRLSATSGVVEVDGPAGTWVHGVQIRPPGPAYARFQSPRASWYSALISPDWQSESAESLVARVRAIPPPGGGSTDVGGTAAQLVDQKHDIASALPLAGALIVTTTFIVLFLFTGSVILPLKALALNALSLTAVLGALVWIFQDGNLSGFLNFTPTPTSTSMPLLLFCIAFGLSMDYEVFILSRIRELHEAGADNQEAVVGGLARAGGIVTTAAALLAVTFFALGLSHVSFIQLFGIGTGLAIIIDATLIRGVLVPSFMALAAAVNWWAPAPLARLHRRIGLSEKEAVQPAAPWMADSTV